MTTATSTPTEEPPVTSTDPHPTITDDAIREAGADVDLLDNYDALIAAAQRINATAVREGRPPTLAERSQALRMIRDADAVLDAIKQRRENREIRASDSDAIHDLFRQTESVLLDQPNRYTRPHGGGTT